MKEGAHSLELYPVLALLAAAVIAGPIFKKLGFGSVLGYLVAGMFVGPFGLGVMRDPVTMLHVAELGVVLFLFIIGLEMRPSRLWGLRKQIFGLGLVQFLGCAVLLCAVAIALGMKPIVAFISSAGFVLTSTAIVVQILVDQHEISSARGQRIVSILLLEDLGIIPLLALVGFVAHAKDGDAATIGGLTFAGGAAALAGVIVTARYLLNPLFRLIANTRSRDVMTATALLVVLGAAYTMQLGGFSMAMGAFLAGVLLAESSFRNQLEVDVEPFRAMLLGLFFLAVGMSLDFGVVLESWRGILLAVGGFMLAKAFGIYCIARLFGSGNREGLERAVLMAQGGEFAFVLYSAAAAGGLIDARQVSQMSAVVIISMMLTPVFLATLRRCTAGAVADSRERDEPHDLSASALVIGFGRVGQIASQLLLARGYVVSIIDTDFTIIEAARNFDLRVYYGDGTQLDVLHAAGAAHARVVLVCVNQTESATRIVQLFHSEFETVAVVARSFDRRHSLDLVRAGANFQVRETFESALLIGSRALQALGASDEEIASTTARIRDRDNERFQRDMIGGIRSGDALFSRPPKSEGS
jgi:glutathione-regulated potassium-efflux system protein KefB